MSEQLNHLVNEWQLLDDARLEANRAAAKATSAAEAAKIELIAKLQEHELSAAGGLNIIAEIKEKEVPTVNDWQSFYEYIKITGAWDLLQKRVGIKAANLRWADNVEIPGLTKTTILTLSRRKTT